MLNQSYVINYGIVIKLMCENPVRQNMYYNIEFLLLFFSGDYLLFTFKTH